MRDAIRLLRAWWRKRRLRGFLAITRICYSSNVWWAEIVIPKTLANEMWEHKQCVVQTHSTLLDNELYIIVPLTPPRNADGVPYCELVDEREGQS